VADNRNERGPRDQQRVNLSEDYEMVCWTKEWGISREQRQRR
jgi:hypothetical protein